MNAAPLPDAAPARRALWDKVAIALAVVCGFHCLLTPFLLIALPVVASTFWVHSDFHLWMLLLVVPTTALALLSGWRRHRDGKILIFTGLGLGLLCGGLAAGTGAVEGVSASACCAAHATPASAEAGFLAIPGFVLSLESLLTSLGGLFLIAGHTRNYRLCRCGASGPRRGDTSR